MDGAPKEAHTLVSDFRSSLTGLLPLDQTMSPDNMSAQLLQRVAADLQKVADPNLQKRVLSAMNAEMAAYGQPTITEAILSLQGQENIDLSPEERELLGATERIGAIAMNDTAEYARIKLQEESLDGEIEAENKKIGGGLGKGPLAVLELAKSMGGTPGGKDDPVMGVHLEQIEKVDELLEALTRPVFSSEYQLVPN